MYVCQFRDTGQIMQDQIVGTGEESGTQNLGCVKILLAITASRKVIQILPECQEKVTFLPR